MTVPLSEREQKILEEIEKTLYKEDPSFARETDKMVTRPEGKSKARIGILVFLLGFGTLIAFFVTGQVIIGVLAFGAMVAGIVLVAGSASSLIPGRGERGPNPGDRLSAAARSWEERLRERYRKR